MSTKLDEITDEVAEAILKSKNEQLHKQKIEEIKKDLESKEGRSFFLCLKKYFDENAESASITAMLKVQKDERTVKIIHETLKTLKSLLVKDKDSLLFQRIEEFEKEYADLEVCTVFNDTIKENEHTELKAAIFAARLKYSKYGPKIEKLKTFLSKWDKENPYNISVELGIIRWMAIAIHRKEVEILESLLTLPEEVMRSIFEETIENNFAKSNIQNKKYYYFFNNPLINLNTIFSMQNTLNFGRCLGYGYPTANTCFETLLSLALRNACDDQESSSIVTKLLNAVPEASLDLNFSFNRDPANRSNCHNNYFHDIIESVCYVYSEDQLSYAGQILDQLIAKGFNNFNFINKRDKDSPFACLFAALTHNLITDETFEFILNHLIKKCRVDYTIQSSVITPPDLSDSESEKRYDDYFRSMSPFHWAITGGDYKYTVNTATIDLMKEDKVKLGFLLQDISRALQNEFEDIADEIMPAINLFNDPARNNSLREKWSRTLKRYTWADPFYVSKKFINGLCIEKPNFELFSNPFETDRSIEHASEATLQPEDKEFFNISNIFASFESDKRSITDFANLWQNTDLTSENAKVPSSAAASSKENTLTSTSVSLAVQAQTRPAIDTKEAADANPNSNSAMTVLNPPQLGNAGKAFVIFGGGPDYGEGSIVGGDILVKPRPGMYLPESVDNHKKVGKFHTNLSRQLRGFYLHFPISQNIRESTLVGYYFNMNPRFPLNMIELQNLVAEYLDSFAANPIQQTKEVVSFLPAFNRGRNLAKRMIASNASEEHMQEALEALTKADVFDQVAICKGPFENMLAAFKAEMAPFQVLANEKDKVDAELQAIRKDNLKKVLEYYLNKLNKRNEVALFKAIFLAIPEVPFHTEFEWLSIGISKITSIKYRPFYKAKFLALIQTCFNINLMDPEQAKMVSRIRSMIENLLPKIPAWDWVKGVEIKFDKNTEELFAGTFANLLLGELKVPPYYAKGIQIEKPDLDGKQIIIQCRISYTVDLIQGPNNKNIPRVSMEVLKAESLAKYQVEQQNMMSSKSMLASASKAVSNEKNAAIGQTAFERHCKACLEAFNTISDGLCMVVEFNHDGFQKMHRRTVQEINLNRDILNVQYRNHIMRMVTGNLFNQRNQTGATSDASSDPELAGVYID